MSTLLSVTDAHVAYGKVEAVRSVSLEVKDREIVTQCKMGMRSQKALEFLRSVGFTNLKNLKGGILAWVDKIDKTMPKY